MNFKVCTEFVNVEMEQYQWLEAVNFMKLAGGIYKNCLSVGPDQWCRYGSIRIFRPRFLDLNKGSVH